MQVAKIYAWHFLKFDFSFSRHIDWKSLWIDVYMIELGEFLLRLEVQDFY